MYIALYT